MPDMHPIYLPTRTCTATLLVLGLSLSGLSAAQQDDADPFIRDAKAGYNARTFFMNRDNSGVTPSNEAWALGGAVFGRSGWWNDTVQLGATYYFSLPLYARPTTRMAPSCSSPARSPSACWVSCLRA